MLASANVLEGVSLINDGTALVIYNAAVVAVGGTFSSGSLGSAKSYSTSLILLRSGASGGSGAFLFEGV